MIMLDVLIQGTIVSNSSAGDTTPVPLPIYLEGEWHSNLTFDIVLSHKSNDNGVSYTLQNQTPVIAPNPSPAISYNKNPELSGNGILMRRAGIFVEWKVGNADWQSLSLSSIPNGSFGGGTLVLITHDYDNDEFIIIKDGGAFGHDIITTPDFVTFTNPVPGNLRNPLTDGVNNLFQGLLSVWYISTQYVAYGLDSVTGDRITATSTDLINWTKQANTISQGAYDARTMAKFGTRYVVHTVDTAGANWVVEIWSSTDGVTWTEATLPAQVADLDIQGLHWLITDTNIELVCNGFVFKSANGTSWTLTRLNNDIAENTPVVDYAGARGKGSFMDLDAGPDHLAYLAFESYEQGGKILSLTEVNAVPTLKNPAVASNDELIGFTDVNLSNLDTFGVENIAQSGTKRLQGFYARNTATTRYFEITVITSGGATGIGAHALGARRSFDAIAYSGGDAYEFFVKGNNIEVTGGPDIVVVYSFSPGDVIGFLFDFTAQTCVIEIDGVLLATVPDLVDTLSWAPKVEALGGSYELNVGQKAFVENGTSAASWLTQ